MSSRQNRKEWPCWRCQVTKPRERFPLGRSGKRHSGVCWACTEDEALARMTKALAYRATWTENGRIVRRCFICKEVKDLERDFYNSPKAGPGSKLGKNAPCKVCTDVRVRENEHKNREKFLARRRGSAKRYVERHPDRVRARNARRWARILADPVWHAQVNEDHRINRVLRMAKQGQMPRTKQSTAMRQPTGPSYLPSEPIAKLIASIVESAREFAKLECRTPESAKAICARLGTTDRNFRRWLAGEQPRIRVGTAERILLNAGVDWHDVYSYDDYAAVFLAGVTA